ERVKRGSLSMNAALRYGFILFPFDTERYKISNIAFARRRGYTPISRNAIKNILHYSEFTNRNKEIVVFTVFRWRIANSKFICRYSLIIRQADKHIIWGQIPRDTLVLNDEFIIVHILPLNFRV